MIIRDELREDDDLSTKWSDFITQDCEVIEDTGEHATDTGKNRWNEVMRAATQSTLRTIDNETKTLMQHWCHNRFVRA